MPTSLKWLHRVGYVTTTIFAILLFVIGYIVISQAVQDAQRAAEQREASRTHMGPLRRSADTTSFGPNWAVYFSPLPSINDLHGNGLRFVALPSLDHIAYAFSLSLSDSASEAEGQLHVSVLSSPYFMEGPDDVRPVESVQRINFTASREAGQALFDRIDALTRTYSGEGGIDCLDGTSVAYERLRGTDIWSDSGRCEAAYFRLASIVQSFVREHVQSPLVPTGEAWHKFPG